MEGLGRNILWGTAVLKASSSSRIPCKLKKYRLPAIFFHLKSPFKQSDENIISI
jgi:hypothetical protein